MPLIIVIIVVVPPLVTTGGNRGTPLLKSVNIRSIPTGARQRQVPIVNFNGLDVYFTTYIVHLVEKHSAKIMPINGHLCRSVMRIFVFSK